MRLLRERGAELVYHDDHVAELPGFGLANSSLADALAGADAAVIVTVHPSLDVEAVVERAPLVVDLRGVTRAIEAPHLTRL